MVGSEGQTIFTAAQHGLLTADFEASGIDPRRFGFYDQLGFLARETSEPDYLARYAEWVMTRPRSAAYEAHVRVTVPKLAHLLGAALAARDARGCCLTAMSMMTRMLDRLQVWSFGLFGSVILEAPAHDLRRAIHTIAVKGAPDTVAGHAWVCAPPFFIVDISLALQCWDGAIAPLIPAVVLAAAEAPRVDARVEDCVHEHVRAMFAEAEGFHDPYLHRRFDPRVEGFLRTFPARETIAGGLRMRFVPVAIRQPFETLAQIELDGDEAAGRTIWNSIVGPAFGSEPLS